MRQVYKAGEQTFVDYAGQQPRLVDPTTGGVIPVELFVAALGASNYTYAKATLTRQSADFIASHDWARLRHELFHAFAALIPGIRELLVALNDRPIRTTIDCDDGARHSASVAAP